MFATLYLKLLFVPRKKQGLYYVHGGVFGFQILYM
jgi:hypothetical protein